MDKNEPRLSKIDVARRHLDSGIKWFFDEGDAVPLHTVFFAASEVLKDLCDARGVTSSFDEIMRQRVKPERRKEFHNALRRHALFYKHANQDPNGETDTINPEANDFLVMFALARYGTLGEALTPSMTAFAAWFGWVHPNCLTDIPNEEYGQAQILCGQFNRLEQIAFGKMFYAIKTETTDIRLAVETFSDKFPVAFAKSSLALHQMLKSRSSADRARPR